MAKKTQANFTVMMLNEFFTAEGMGWISVYPEFEDSVIVRYVSRAKGGIRLVRCRASLLLRWVHDVRSTQGWKDELRGLLEKKPEYHSPEVQMELKLGLEAEPLKVGMAPGE